MSKPTSAGRRAVRAPCGARLPSASQALPRAAAGSVRPRRTGHDRLLLSDGTWRHVETIRVRSLFG
ncbi:hypothetical protein ABZ770_06080 [Streptomyces sp. NPDC006654]|uniref:hypothetical protein n=1 Tax=unclassified Streptomyces TaxID=2593676 RepID=UPI0033D641B7